MMPQLTLGFSCRSASQRDEQNGATASAVVGGSKRHSRQQAQAPQVGAELGVPLGGVGRASISAKRTPPAADPPHVVGSGLLQPTMPFHATFRRGFTKLRSVAKDQPIDSKSIPDAPGGSRSSLGRGHTFPDHWWRPKAGAGNSPRCCTRRRSNRPGCRPGIHRSPSGPPGTLRARRAALAPRLNRKRSPSGCSPSRWCTAHDRRRRCKLAQGSRPPRSRR
jgi:hypothetical protein